MKHCVLFCHILTLSVTICVFSTKYNVKLQTPERGFVVMTEALYEKLKSIIIGLSEEELKVLMDYVLSLKAQRNQ